MAVGTAATNLDARGEEIQDRKCFFFLILKGRVKDSFMQIINKKQPIQKQYGQITNTKQNKKTKHKKTIKKNKKKIKRKKLEVPPLIMTQISKTHLNKTKVLRLRELIFKKNFIHLFGLHSI